MHEREARATLSTTFSNVAITKFCLSLAENTPISYQNFQRIFLEMHFVYILQRMRERAREKETQ